MLWDRETLLLDLTETCVGILVAVTCALSYLLLLVALPPVILLQRSLMHQQLAAAARTDPKTGLLNATAWQREADAEVAPFKAGMTADAFARAREGALDRLVRERYKLPSIAM